MGCCRIEARSLLRLVGGLCAVMLLVLGPPAGEARADVVGVELDSAELSLGFSGRPQTPPPVGGVFTYGVFHDLDPGLGSPFRVIFDQFVLQPSLAVQVFDLTRSTGPYYDPFFDGVAAAVTSGPPPDTLFAYTLGLAGELTTVWNSSPEVALAAPPGTCVQSFRLEVSPFAFVESSPGFFTTDPWPLPATLTAFGTPLEPSGDADGDTLTDADEELVYGTDPCARDTDHDGLPDPAELFSGPFGTDPLDPDSDDDGFEDGVDNCPAAFYEETGLSGYNPDQANADGDLRGDACDIDDDNDAVLDVDDACPTVPHLGFDADGDGCRDSLPGFIDSVQLLVTHHGVANSLERKAADAHHLLCVKDNEWAALQKLAEIESYLEAQAGKHLSEEVAEVLQAYVENLFALRLGPATDDICT